MVFVLGTLSVLVPSKKKIKRDILLRFLPNKQSCRFNFVWIPGRNNISHVEKQGKATIMVSSMYNKIYTDPDLKKPEIIVYCCSNKGEVEKFIQ